MPISMPTPTKRPVVPSRNSLKRLLVEVLRVRVEPGDHAGDGVGDQLLLVDRLDVVALDHAEHGGELLQLLQRQRRQRARAKACSCIVVSAPATAPSAMNPATFSLALHACSRHLTIQAPSQYKTEARFECEAAVKVAPRLRALHAGRGHGAAREGDDVVHLGADADPLADLVVVVRGHVRQHLLAAGQAQRVEELRAAEGLALDARLHRRRVVVDDVVGAQQHVALAAGIGVGQRALGHVGQCGRTACCTHRAGGARRRCAPG